MISILHISLLFCLSISIAYVQGGAIEFCDHNEEYKQCGSSCPPSCDDLAYPQKVKICTLQCVVGCFCKKDYYRSKSGRCVIAKQCCKGENEQYSECGTACPETCKSGSQLCKKQCVPGCYCTSSDFVRKDNSTNSPCIKRDQC